jgi:hypothetical protein
MADFSAQQVMPDDWDVDAPYIDPLEAQAATLTHEQATIPDILAQESLADHYETPVFFVMKAYNTTLLQYVMWESENGADFGGLQSGYPPIQLSGTALIGTYL